MSWYRTGEHLISFGFAIAGVILITVVAHTTNVLEIIALCAGIALVAFGGILEGSTPK